MFPDVEYITYRFDNKDYYIKQVAVDLQYFMNQPDLVKNIINLLIRETNDMVSSLILSNENIPVYIKYLGLEKEVIEYGNIVYRCIIEVSPCSQIDGQTVPILMEINTEEFNANSYPIVKYKTIDKVIEVETKVYENQNTLTFFMGFAVLAVMIIIILFLKLGV